MIAQRRKVKSRHSSAHPKKEVVPIVPAPSTPALPRSRGINLQSYCELIPFLSVALSDGLFDPFSVPPPTTSTSAIPFTHFIRVQYSTPLLKPGFAWLDHHLKTSTSVLNLIVPAPKSPKEQTSLSEHQLLLSRDFLSLALPYYCRSEPPTWADELLSADMAHVLITAPPGPFLGSIESSGTADVMSIVTCYLTFASGQEATSVVKCLDDELAAFNSGLADVWKGKIKRNGVEIIQRGAIAL